MSFLLINLLSFPKWSVGCIWSVPGMSCLTHSWRWSNWSFCLPHDKQQCGRGQRLRFAECQRSDGVITTRELCFKVSTLHSQNNMTTRVFIKWSRNILGNFRNPPF